MANSFAIVVNSGLFFGSGLFQFGRRKSHCDLDFGCFETISENKCGIVTEIALQRR
jgi:hypothetical protein